MSKELDGRLRQFIEDPTDFLAIMSFVASLHSQPVLAASQPYAIEVDGQQVTPVFTDEKDLEAFKEQQTSARNQEWIERSTLEVLEEVIVKQLSGLVFNVKRTGDMANTTVFKSSELIAFVNHYTDLLNRVMGDRNIAAELRDKYFLVPVFVHSNDDGTSDRLFPSMSTPDGEVYLPIFSNLQSFAKWYNDDKFGQPFKQASGVVVAWKLSDIKSPESGENDISDSLGVVLDAFDDKQYLIKWDTI